MAQINFLGDLIFGDQPVLFGLGFDSKWSKYGYKGIFSYVSGITNSAEINIANFESVIRERPEKETVRNWAMCCDKRICDELIKAQINVLSIANNHSFDYGNMGFELTIKELEHCGIKVIGKKECPGIVLNLDGKKIGIIAASYLKTMEKDVGYFFNPSKDEWVSAIKDLGKIDKCIAYVHWGNEFVTNPTFNQIEIMKTLLSVGISDIIGHHPHILQTKYITDNGNRVFFSLGNFISDYWQKRLRRSEIIQYNVSMDDYYQIKCEINGCGIPAIDGDFTKVCFDIEHHEAKNIFLNRLRMRIEYLFKILINFPRIKGKRVFLKWLLKRIRYVVSNIIKEIKNPDIIYEKYER